jgi:hypothetical protein
VDTQFINVSLQLVGMGIINNAVERTSASVLPIMEISDANHQNIIIWNNSLAGSRFNHENDISAPLVNKVFTDYISKNNIFDARGDHRADIFGAGDSTMIGTWSVGYSVGWAGNWNEAINYAGDTDYWGLHSRDAVGVSATSQPTNLVRVVSNASRSGTDAGGGNYRTLSTGNGPVLQTRWLMPYDIEGNARGELDPPGAYSSASPRKGGGFF